MITLTLILVFLTSSLIMPINAYDSIDIGYVNWNTRMDNAYRPVQNTALVHSSGKYVYASSYHGTYGDWLRVRVIDSSGSLVVNFDHETSTTRVLGLRVSEYDDNEVLILCVKVAGGTYSNALTGVIIVLNLDTYTYNVYTSSAFLAPNTSGVMYSKAFISNEHLQNSDTIFWYGVAFNDYAANPDKQSYFILKFIYSTHVLSSPKNSETFFTPSTTNFQSPVVVSLSSTTFGVWSFLGVTSTPEFYVYDITGNTFTLHVTFSSSYKIYYNRYFTVIKTGYEEKLYGNDTHIFPYIYYTTGTNLGAYTPSFLGVLLRIEYNNTVSVGDILGTKVDSISVSPYSMSTASDPIWTIGGVENDLETFYIWYPKYDYYDAIEGFYYHKLSKITVTVTDFYDLGTGINLISDVEDYESAIPIRGYNDLVARKMSDTFQTEIIYGTDDINVYYDITPVMDSFTMTYYYTPLDTPLVQNKRYDFTYTFKNYGVAYKGGIVLIIIDDALISSKVTSVAGTIQFSLQFSTIGYHSVKIEFYKSMTEPTPNIEDTDFYMVTTAPVPPDIPDYLVLGDTLMNVVTGMLPTLVCVLLPAYAGGKKGGLVGYLGGFIIGVAIAVNAALIPIYYAYLLALVIIMGFVFAIRSGGGSS